MQLFKKILYKIGIDGAIGFTLIGRLIQSAGGLILIALISLYLTKEEQGYYYTFGSIIAIQVFFELGLNGIITQYVAHELVHLEWKSEVELTGNKERLSRISSLLHLCLKVFGSITIILFTVLSLFGFIFFTRFHDHGVAVHWQLPWIISVLATSAMFLINALLAFLEGLGKVKQVAKIRAMYQIINVITIAFVFTCKGNLFALGIGSLVSFLVISLNIYFSYNKHLFVFIYNAKGEWVVDYWKEIFPYQWKIALSWLSGFFIFQLFSPVLFATEGAVAAGQMGMTLAALNGISSLSMSWITTKVPTFSALIAEEKYQLLDLLFYKTVRQLSYVNFSLITVLIAFVFGLNYFNLALAHRFLDLTSLLLLCVVTFINQYVFSWATYLRCHKREPFLVNSISTGILCGFSTFILGKEFGLIGIVIGYSVISTFFGLPWAYYIFKNKKNEWHNINFSHPI